MALHELITEKLRLEFVRVPAGAFLMGEQPEYQIFVDTFDISKYPVTTDQCVTFLYGARYAPPEIWTHGYSDGRFRAPSHKGNHPVTHVNWHNAHAFCQWLSDETGYLFRLPTEAEWEKAARGTDGRLYPWGNEWDEKKLNNAATNRDTTSVGSYSPAGDSPYGAGDMLGNVAEWCSSIKLNYPYALDDGREDQETDNIGQNRVVRGSSWNIIRHQTINCMHRDHAHVDTISASLGFRIALSR